jgi:hypothetical protein
MDITKMLAELRQEREAIEEAILTLERLARGRGKRRGRPPAWLSEMRKKEKPAANTSTKSKTANLTRTAIAV